MNLFTRFLSAGLRNDSAETLIQHWDTLEQCVISVYKADVVTREDHKIYTQNRQRFLQIYANHKQAMIPFWKTTVSGGALTERDPFLRVIIHETADGILGDWGALQHLASAREALNKYVMTLTGDSEI